MHKSMKHKLVATLLAASTAFALNCGPNMLTFQDSAASTVQGAVSQDATSQDSTSQAGANGSSATSGGIICVFVTNGSTPRMAFYGEGRLGQGREYRFLGHAFAAPPGGTSQLSGQQSSQQSASGQSSLSQTEQSATSDQLSGQAQTATGGSSPTVSVASPMVTIGGYQVESQLYGSFAGTLHSSADSTLKSIGDQMSFTVSTDRIIVTDGTYTRTWLLKTDLPNYQPLDLPLTCGDKLDGYKVRYPPGVKVPTPAVGLRCVMPHRTNFLITYFGVGRMQDKPYMYLATRGKGGQWGRVGICWHNPQLMAAGKCPKSGFGEFLVKPVDLSNGQADVSAEVQNGMRELWIPKLHKKNAKGSSSQSTSQSSQTSSLSDQA